MSGTGRDRSRHLEQAIPGAGRHEPHHGLRVFVSGTGRWRYQAFRICRPADPARQHRLRSAASPRNMADCRNCGRFHGRGLMIIGVPSNDFGGQEPGGATEITATAQNHHVTFPIAAKAVVKGANAHPFYKWAAEARPKDVPALELPQIPDRPGRLHRGRICKWVEPADTRVKTAIARALAQNVSERSG